jgi:hypothetical protein
MNQAARPAEWHRRNRGLAAVTWISGKYQPAERELVRLQNARVIVFHAQGKQRFALHLGNGETGS